MKAPVESPGFRARALFFFFSGLRTAYRQSAASVRAVEVSTIRADHQRAAKNDPEPRPHLSCRALFLVQEVQHMPRGRRKGSTGTYFRWPPKKIADMWQDAQFIVEKLELLPSSDSSPHAEVLGVVATRINREGPASKQERVNKQRVARLLKQEFPDKYRYVTEEQLRQLLSKAYQRKTKLDDLDAFNASVLAHMLGETDETDDS